MYPSKTPWLFVLQALIIGAAVITCLIVTGNALSLFGLMMLWQAPPLVPGPDTPQNGSDPEEGGGEEQQGNQIGFVHGQ